MVPELLFDWDEENRKHLRRHKILPAEFEQVVKGAAL